jgi:hypothetical protein
MDHRIAMSFLVLGLVSLLSCPEAQMPREMKAGLQQVRAGQRLTAPATMPATVPMTQR